MMEKKIAVFWDKDKNISSMQEASELAVYSFDKEKWYAEESLDITGLYEGGIVRVRNKTFELVKKLGGCRIIAGKNITGVIYNILNSEGFIISELNVFAEDDLEYLYSQIEDQFKDMEKEREEALLIPTAPSETEEKGDYFFDFSLLKNTGTKHSSKSTILPFLNNADFRNLEIICDHVMPWFEEEMKKRGLYYIVKERDDKKISILIEKKH
jgi:Fe-only nitrogenase accessory protein AnfO